MPYLIERKLVVGISSSALFNLEKEDEIYRKNGVEAYKKYQADNKRKILDKGLAYPFIRRFLNINKVYSEQKPVEVVLLSRNNPESGLRIFNSIKEYGLDISRAAFTAGKNPCLYIPAYNISLFLSTNHNDVEAAISNNMPAGLILKSIVHDDDNDNELRVAFDFDGVLADDSVEKVFQETKQLDLYFEHETQHKDEPIHPGLLKDFFTRFSYFQKMENKKLEKDPSYIKIVRTAIVTARNAPAHERAVNTLKSWNVEVDEMFFLGGIEKKRVLSILKPHLFIDDQIVHLDQSMENVTLVHIPFGITNNKQKALTPAST